MGSRKVTFASDWQGRNITVAGLGVSGISAARALAGLGASVTVVDGGSGAAHEERAARLRAEGIAVRLGDAESLPPGTDLVVTSPGWKPTSPLFAAAAEAGVDVIGDVEVAWRLRGPDAAPWLAVTGTNGKTTTTQMLASILQAAGLRTAAVGNIGTPIVDVILEGDDAYDVLAVELSSYQLHWAPSVRAHSATVLNLAPDHLDWHGSMEAYAADKGRIYEGNHVACVYNVDAVDKPSTEDLVREADVEEGCRAIGFTLNAPAPSQLGVVDGILVDRAFVPDRQKQAQELAEISDVQPPAPHNIANALAAAALARAFGVQATAVRDGLRAFRPDAPPRRARRRRRGGRLRRRLQGHQHPRRPGVVGGVRVDRVDRGRPRQGRHLRRTRHAQRRSGCARRPIGADRALIREALARHAPRGPGRRPRPDRHWGDVRGGTAGGGAGSAGGHRADGPGLCVDGHVHQLQQAW